MPAGACPRRLLDHALAAFTGAGITDVCFIGGYQIDKVKRDCPHSRSATLNGMRSA